MVIIIEGVFLVWLAALILVVKKLLRSINDLRPSDAIVSYYHPVRRHYYRSHPRLGHYILPRQPVARAAAH
ncbi:MAG TPA: hypothetical protein VKU87_12290 [Thermomicrobiaceae bacterium]|nr:hypothetical protein [Thermomicrobiaceae bacterium]